MTSGVETVAFGAHGLQMDIHRSAVPGAAVTLYVHGGGFARGDRAGHANRIEALVASGLTIASVDYRLAPDVRYPAPIDDVVDAARSLRDADSLGRPQVLGAIGASAGGYLATMAALRPEVKIGAVSPWFAPFDFFASSRRTLLEANLFPVSYEANLVGVVLDDDHLKEASAINHDLTSAPPFLLVHGDRDRVVPIEQSAAMHAALLRAGRNSSLLRVGGAGHEDAAFDGGPTVQLVAAWIRSTLAAETAPA